jgi:ADP-ribosylglycohydrolase
METTERRILACLIGIATGDAVGKQTESSPATRCCAGIQMACTDSRDLPGRQSRDTVTTRSVHGSSGKRRTTLSERWQSRGRLFGTVTCRTRASDASCSCAENACIRAFRHCGSSTRPPILREWPSATMAAERAVRVAPVGLRHRPDRLDDIVAAAREASIPTHGGPLAIAAAAATAAAVSAAVEALSAEEIIDFARRAAATAERERTDPPATRFAEALGGIVRELRGWRDRHAGAIGARYFPNDPLTIVPLALALGTITNSAQAAILLAANIGPDSDSVASIAGGVAGAINPASGQWATVVDDVNGHDLVSMAEALTTLRH